MNKILLFSLLLLLPLLVSCQNGQPPALHTAAVPTASEPPDLTVQTPPPAPTSTLTESATTIPTPAYLSPTLPVTPTPEGISVQEDAMIPPIPPPQVDFQRQDGDILLSWPGTGSDIDTHYVVYQQGAPDENWQAIGFVAVFGDNRGMYQYQDTDTDPQKSYTYGVSSVNRYGKESSLATIDIPSSP